jgi:hypothetical protein
MEEFLAALFSGPTPSLSFNVLLEFHAFAGLTCVITGAIAMLSKKRRGRHPWFGEIYFWALSVVFITMTGMSGLRWAHDYYLFILGTISFSSASIGYAARKIHWKGWTGIHITGMSLSYIVLLTAFYVDNGPNLPLGNRLPLIVFWIGPSLIGLPLLTRPLIRYTHFAADLRSTANALASSLAINELD